MGENHEGFKDVISHGWLGQGEDESFTIVTVMKHFIWVSTSKLFNILVLFNKKTEKNVYQILSLY